MDYFAHPLGCMLPTLVPLHGGDIEASDTFPSPLPVTFQSLTIYMQTLACSSGMKLAHGCWAMQQMLAFCICWLSHITQVLHSAGFCSKVLSFHKTVPEFPAIISELKTPSPSTWYLYSASRIKNLSLFIFVFMDWKITQHFPTSFTYSLFVSSLFSTKGISLPIFFFFLFP